MANYRFSTNTNNNNKTTQDKTNKKPTEETTKIIIQFNSLLLIFQIQQLQRQLPIIIIIQFSIIYMPSRQLEDQLQKQHSVDSGNYIKEKHNVKTTAIIII
jgi:hypothetical protein